MRGTIWYSPLPPARQGLGGVWGVMGVEQLKSPSITYRGSVEPEGGGLSRDLRCQSQPFETQAWVLYNVTKNESSIKFIRVL